MNVANSSVVYRATVIGAGPAGLACVGNLLDNLPITEKILWIDPQFLGGRLSSYPAVPSNTKVCLFTKFAEECRAFDSAELKSLKILKEQLDGQKGCQLKFAAELCQEITGKVLKIDNLKSIKNVVTSLNYFEDFWIIETSDKSIFKSKMIFLTTGSKPKSLNLPDDSIELDDALNPEILKQKIQNYQTISVYGSSHSAMLVLKNLLKDGKSIKPVTNYYRQPTKFASFPDPINCPDKILHDNTGLKGEVAEWVKTWIGLDETELKNKFNLERMKSGDAKKVKSDSENTKSDSDNTKSDSDITKSDSDNTKSDSDNTKGNSDNHATNKIATTKSVKNVNIFAVGYERNSLPQIIYNQTETEPKYIDYTVLGQLTNNNPDNKSSTPLKGIFGFGIAFPERVKNLDGSDEAAVGMWKFMKHVKKSIKLILQ